ncbi:hypothetical protein CONLIGDRAFT_634305 [Coniochaeta ligniaria NRRL 30616]|uniref:Uncharacterized protein n=1 Tax=Coniochaeta ligniaria NRRL 30616 TaxID=1408157 RepID=A0A1J7IK84_9PEZI|nr:hypothetical protein CONLIGDRAFT_634305 [Coniochaeta ligniaria NRRL 30616]
MPRSFRRLLSGTRWDSSDPERAPPPLPLNPQSPSVNTSRAGTSAAIQSAHQALTEKARETALVPSLAKRIADVSPDRSMAKNSAHRRMQSLQPGTVRDLSYMIESGRDSNVSTPRSPEKTDKPSTPSTSRTNRDPFVDSRTDDRDEKALVATPRPGPSITPIIRPTVRRPQQSILGKNTPPQSATMLALQNMSTPTQREPSKEPCESALANITNTSTAMVRAPESLNALSSQILSLTSIATSLQKEMSQLSRRSRDNATDLLSLREATNTRDEDIRKTLRDLVHNMSEAKARAAAAAVTRDPYGNPLMLESKAHHSHGFTSPTSMESKLGKVSLPRIPSPNSFAASLDRESMSTPSLYGPDAPATVALLEKIVREMGTREGQDLLLGRLTELSERLTGMATAGKVDELRRAVESSRQDKSVVAAAGGGGRGGGNTHNRALSFDDDDEDRRLRQVDYNYQSTGPMTQRVERLLHDSAKEPRRSSAPAATVVNDEVIKVIKTVKDSVAQGGGLTAEVKALVRELRGEVLGMGREIGRRLDEIAAKSANRSESATKEEMTKVVEEGLNEMKQHINHLIKEHRRQSAATAQAAAKINAVDYHEIYNAMRAALKDSQAQKPTAQELSREDVIEAVKEAWENYKPEIEIQQIGLERDEILACLQEGLQANPRQEWATRDEVFAAVVEGLRHFTPPRVETQASLSRDEILEAVRECLEEFEFPAAEAAVGEGVSREDVLEAVKEGLHAHEGKITREEVLDAVQEGLHERGGVAGISKEDVLDAVHVALESYDFPARSGERAGEILKEDVVEAVREGLAGLEGQLSSALVPAGGGSITKEDVMDAVHQSLSSFDFPFPETATSARAVGGDISRDDIVDAVREGLRDLDLPQMSSSHALVPSSRGNDADIVARLQDIMEFMRDEFKAVSDEAKQNVAANGRDTEQVLDATKDGFERLRADMETYVDRACGDAGQEEFLTNLVRTLDGFRDEVTELVAKSSDGSREVIRTEVESLREAVNSSLVPMPQAAVGNHKEVLEALQDGLAGLRSEINSRPIAGVNEILDALQEGLGDLRGSIDRLQNKPVDLTANDEILDALKSGLDSVRSEIDVLREESKNDKALTTFDNAATAMIPADMAKHEDIKNLEVLITQLRIKVEAMEAPPMAAANVSGVAKEDLAEMEETLRTLQDAVASVSDTVAGMSISVLGVSDAVTGVSESVLGVSARVEQMASPEGRASTDPSTREDVQAIETILRNTKARLDDLIDGEQAVRKEHIDVLETLILETRESLSGLSSHLDSVSRKEDITIVESLVTQVVGAFDEMKERHEKALEDPEKVTKTDVEAVEAVCLDVKSLVEQVVKADLAALPSKEDLAKLENLLKEYKDKIDAGAESQSKDLELRQLETVGVGERVSEVKTFLEEFQGVVKEKLDQGATGIDAMNKILDSLGETLNKNATISDDLKDMFLVMKDEFEESKAGVVGAKLEADEKFQQTTDTIVTKLDERIGELVAKYDDFQLVMEDRAVKGEARDAEMEAAMLGSKAIAEELKSLIDTLGTAVTDSMEKMEEASKTVFTHVEDLLAKSDENHSDDKAEHQLTRDHVKEAVTIVEGLQGHVVEYQPKILESIKDVLLLVGQHYEHAKTATSDLQQSIASKIDEAKPEPLMLQDIPKYDDTGLHEKLDKLVDHTTEADKALERLETLDLVHKQVVQTATEISAFLAAQTQRIEEDHEDREKTLQETNILLERRLAEKEQLEATIASLKEENEQLRQERQEETERLKLEREEEAQRLRTEREEESARLKQERQEEIDRLKLEHQEEEERFRQSLREQEERFKLSYLEEETRFKTSLREEAERHKVHLQEQEKRYTSGLQEEEQRLKKGLQALRAEQDSLNKQKMRLSADLSSLETALRLRKEELHDMEARAEGLERRILEGVMDHSRVLLMAKANRPTTNSAIGKDPMSRKRVPSQKPVPPPTAPITTAAAARDTKPKTAFNMAMNSTANRTLAAPNQARRILSLSQITGNVSPGGFKRSQSVRQTGGAGAYRKSSWGGSKGPASKRYGDLGGDDHDKENAGRPIDLLRESEEEHHDADLALITPPAESELTRVGSEGGYGDGDISEGETLRRSSRGTTVYTGTEMSYDGTEDYSEDEDGYARSEWTESGLGTESYLGTESMVSEGETPNGEVVLYHG